MSRNDMEDKLDTVIKRVSKRGTIKYKWIVDEVHEVLYYLNNLIEKGVFSDHPCRREFILPVGIVI